MNMTALIIINYVLLFFLLQNYVILFASPKQSVGVPHLTVVGEESIYRIPNLRSLVLIN